VEIAFELKWAKFHFELQRFLTLGSDREVLGEEITVKGKTFKVLGCDSGETRTA
jgi:hypothetical protein